jgi:hypothetical protein
MIVPRRGTDVCDRASLEPHVLTANGNEDLDSWGPRYIWGRFTKYTWNIQGDN